MSNILVNLFASVKEPVVIGTVSLSTIFHLIETGGNNLASIKEARHALLKEGNKSKYNQIKESLSCANYGFTFDGYKNTENVIGPTGILPFDVDNSLELIENELVYASFPSLSTRGMTYLVRVDELNTTNYRFNYERIAEKLGIEPDMNAGKATQAFVLPHSKINFYPDAKVLQAYAPKNTHFIPEKKERVIGTEMGTSSKVRFSNLNDYTSSIDFDGEAIFDFKEKFEYASLYVPTTRITEGNRNKIFSGIGYQFRCLNTNCTLFDIENLLSNINEKYGQPRLPHKEIKSISKSIFRIPIKDLVPVANDTKRFIFNPDYDLTLKEKRSLVMTSLNKEKALKTKEVMAECIGNWDFPKRGKITQKKLAKITGKNIKTIRKHYSQFKNLIKFLNDKNKPP